MKQNDFYECYDERGEKQSIKKILVTFCILVVAFIIFQYVIDLPPDVRRINSNGISINGNVNAAYYGITSNQKAKYGISWDYDPCEDDLGDLVGIVWNWNPLCYQGFNGCKVYSYAKCPEKETIRVVKTPSSYYFICCEELIVDVNVGRTSNVLLSAYKLPESLEKIEVLTLNNEYTEITDKNVNESILKVLSGKINIGEEKKNRRHAEMWYDTYGNDDMYFDEKEGRLMLDHYSIDPTNYLQESREVYDKAYALLNEGSKKFAITTKQGFTLNINYLPAARLFQCENAFYNLSDSDVEKLNHLIRELNE